MPIDTGIAFVITTHLAPGHSSSLPEILARSTLMPVSTAEDHAEIEADHVYVCPPDRVLTIEGSRLRLRRAPTPERRPIDVFLTSLAKDRGDTAIGILLSGGGTDGTLGLKAIKEADGLTIAQGSDGTAPQHPGMPDSAIGAGVVDLVLSVEDMAPRLADVAREFRVKRDDGVEREAADHKEIHQLLLKQVGHDFSGYKQNTFVRRVRRRMQVLDLPSLSAYTERLRTDGDEVTALFKDLLIGVTNFFRDTDAFAALETTVVPKLFAGKGVADTVRVWVPGCATGEEVYSLAMLMREHAEGLKAPPKIQLFATDIDDHALGVARAGRYPAQMLETVSEERLRRHFTGDDLSKTVRKEVRDLCVFSTHSVLRDPPFSRMDLISCRNLLIYLGPSFQSLVVPVFHYALVPHGYLFLGTSETISQHGDLFASVEKKHRIFQRRQSAAAPLRFPQFQPASRSTRDGGRDKPAAPAGHLRREVETHVLDRFAPAHVVVNIEGEIVHYSARTGRYLEPASGLPSRDLLAMTRRDLRPDVRAALSDAQRTRSQVTRRAIPVAFDGHLQLVDVIVEPLPGHEGAPLFLVLFQDVTSIPAAQGAAAPVPSSDSVERLEQELRENRERLQATVEQYETAVEELKSANEELQSTNEELQSSNEEHETAREELQSVNEELHTVNAELNDKVEELDRAHADLRNVFDATRVATVFLDRDLIIRTFTPSAREIFHLIPSDRGRPLTDIVSRLENYRDLPADLRQVFEAGEIVERRVRRADGSTTYLMRLLPYRSGKEVVEGVLVTFVDVSTVIETERQLRTLIDEVNHRVRNMLTVVVAIATQTLARTPNPAHFAEAFRGRIQSMAHAHTLVARHSWGDVELRDILMIDLQEHAEASNGRVVLDGPPIYIKPPAAIALNVVFHELATNAVRHGALAEADGRLSVSWEVRSLGDERQLLIAWREHDGPPVEFSGRKGLGTVLIEHQLKSPLNGIAEFDYARSGLIVRIVIPENPRLLAAPSGALA